MKNKQLNLLLGLAIVLFTLSCEQQNADLTNELKSNPRKDKGSDLRGSISSSPESFLDPCDRVAINPCDYSNNEDYSQALVNELEHQVNDCILTAVYACGNEETCCHPHVEIYPTHVYTDIPTDPWKYCFERTACDSFWCQSAGAYIHLSGTVDLQDWMISEALQIADDNKPSCTYFGGSARVEKIEFIRFTQRFNCTGTNPSGCYNTIIYIKVTYFCNDCGSES